MLPNGLSETVSSFYAGRLDGDFAELMSRHGLLDDSELAELIEHDGRMRLARNLPTTLERYLDAVPDLPQRRDALDAAIDVNLRWLAGGSRTDRAAVEHMVQQHPHLEAAIRDAAALGNALWSTAGLRKHMERRQQRDLPQEFGPRLDDGLPRYTLEVLLGAGAFGEVYRAVDRKLSEEGHPALVAVKILSHDPETGIHQSGPRLLSRDRLLEEATKARRVNHPNVVRVLDRGIADDDAAYIVYDYVEGGDLDRWIASRTSAIPMREAARLVAQIARGVQAAHSAGLVHCDLKPGNIILNADGEPKVADFGIAIRFGQSRIGEEAAEALASDHPVGNVAFISPEQYRMDDGALTVPSDVYAIGGMLFMLLTGTLPNGSSLKAIAQTHDRKNGRVAPPLLRPLRPEVDRDLEAICRRAMAINPAERYSSAGALADDLEAWMRAEPLYWTNPSAFRVVRLWSKRKPAAATSLTLLLVAILTAAITVAHYSRVAAAAEVERAQAQMQAEIAEFKEAAVTARQQDARRILEHVSVTFAQRLESDRTTSEILAAIWVLQHLNTSTGMASAEAMDKLQVVQYDAVKHAVDKAYAEGRENELDALLWRTMLAFWTIAKNEARDAMPMLEELESQWSQLLEPSDRWLADIQAMKACAMISMASKSIDQGEAITLDTDGLHDAADFLRAHEAVVRAHEPRSPIHHLIIDSLVNVYRPQLLNDIQMQQQASAIYDEVKILRDHQPRR